MCFGDVENEENNGVEYIGLGTPSPDEELSLLRA